MPIVVKHSGNVAPSAVAAFAGGQGQRQAEDARQAASLAAQARESNRSRKFAGEQADAGRRFQSDQTEAARKFQSDEVDQSRAFQTQREDLSFERSFELAADAQGRQQQNVEFGYSAKQRAAFDEYSQAYDEAANSGDFTDEQLAEVKAQLIGKMGGIQRMPRLKKESPYPAGQNIGETWNSPDERFILTRDKDGQVKKLAETNNTPTVKDIADLYGQAAKALTKQNADGTDVAASQEDIEAWVDRAITLHQKYANKKASSPDQEWGGLPEGSLKDDWGVSIDKDGGLQLPVPENLWDPQVDESLKGTPEIKSQEEFDDLPSGTEFMDPEGNLRRKP